MNTKNIFSSLIIVTALLFYYSFAQPFKEIAVDNVTEELTKLETAYTQANEQLSLKALRTKKQSLTEKEISLLNNFVPANLHSGTFVYNLAQMANQNRMTLKSLQYSIMSEQLKKESESKILVEFTMDGRYEDFANWLRNVEKSDVLIEIDSFRGVKLSNNGEIISFSVKLYSYGQKID